MVAAAIAGAAIVGAGATAYAGSQSASATQNATNASIAAQNAAQARQQALNQPYANIGTGTPGPNGQSTGGAIQQYQNLLGLGPQGPAGIEKTLAATPGYQFALNQGLNSTKNAASASGMALSGNTLEALDQYSTGLADTTYQQALGNAQNAVTIGQNAAAGTGAGIMQTGAGIAGALQNQGNTLAGIDVNTAAGITKALGSGVNQYATYNTLQGLNNPSSGVTSSNGWGDSGSAPSGTSWDGG
jgi:hypothetical protein